ncbi:hypothetical protein OG320_15090 [Microbispora sp. NBC_01189]|uniref:hypothetical protein n=1 Tax=Microbispora sp. NBC_01189 TaxID=2903583 RepID=UPI002E15ACF7|nr:hypothetical protein OG320_15090 [Microbispora sp. NBC_01189]
MSTGFNPLDATSLLTAFGAAGVFVVLFAETGLLIGFFLPETRCCSPRVCCAPPRSAASAFPCPRC